LKKKYDYLIVGAGFAGAVAAERIATQLNKRVLLIEKRNHIGGNAFDEVDEHGILVHRYGPHIFHTNSREVFDYLSKFTEWRFYEHKVLASLNNKLYPVPINRNTLNSLYNLKLNTEKEVEEYYNSVRGKRYPILNSEDVIIDKVGVDLFEKFFKHYTKKQWNLEPKDLAPLVCGRIPVRVNDDCRYFTDKYQFMPKDGYTKMFEKMLTHKNIEIILNTDYKAILSDIKFDKLIYTGPIDYFFDYMHGRLPYRSIRFEWENYPLEYLQECAVINYVDDSVEYTRMTEYRYLTGHKGNNTTISKEYAQLIGDPFYPTLTENSKKIYQMYELEAEKLKNVIFVGRLATFKYFNMDQVVGSALTEINKVYAKR
jgi:UDP-galactopyranose mutase